MEGNWQAMGFDPRTLLQCVPESRVANQGATSSCGFQRDLSQQLLGVSLSEVGREWNSCLGGVELMPLNTELWEYSQCLVVMRWRLAIGKAFVNCQKSWGDTLFGSCDVGAEAINLLTPGALARPIVGTIGVRAGVCVAGPLLLLVLLMECPPTPLRPL